VPKWIADVVLVDIPTKTERIAALVGRPTVLIAVVVLDILLAVMDPSSIVWLQRSTLMIAVAMLFLSARAHKNYRQRMMRKIALLRFIATDRDAARLHD
jgi:hypothetical protein